MGIIIPIVGITAPWLPSDALFGQTRQRILALLFGRPDQRFYQQHVIQTVGLGSGTVQRDLERLTRAGILVRKIEGRQTYYQANRQCPVFDELRGIVRKTFGVAQVLREALTPVVDRICLSFIFGSLAAGTETIASDVDLLVVGDNLQTMDLVSAVSEAQRDLGREINPSAYTTREFCRKLAQGQHFICSVVAGPKIFVIGDEGELTRLAQIRVAQRAQDKPARDRRPPRRG